MSGNTGNFKEGRRLIRTLSLSGEVILFDPEEHIYYLESGEKLDSVTNILKTEGLIETRFMNKKAAIRGSLVHKAIEQMNRGEKILRDFELNHIYPYLEAYYWFLVDTGFKPDLIEQTVVDVDRKIAGTLDITGTIGNKKLLVDIKTGVPCDWHPIQLAAYAVMGRFEHFHRYCLHLNSGTTYRLKGSHRRLGDYNDPKWVEQWFRIANSRRET